MTNTAPAWAQPGPLTRHLYVFAPWDPSEAKQEAEEDDDLPEPYKSRLAQLAQAVLRALAPFPEAHRAMITTLQTEFNQISEGPKNATPPPLTN